MKNTHLVMIYLLLAIFIAHSILIYITVLENKKDNTTIKTDIVSIAEQLKIDLLNNK